MLSTYDDQKVSANDLSEKLIASDLTYVAENTSNVVVERTRKVQYSQAREYFDGDEVIVDWQTGNDFISARDSFLKFKLDFFKADKTTTPTTSVPRFEAKDSTDLTGSVLNLLRTVRVVARSSDVLTHIEKANLLAYQKTRYERTKEWVEQQGKTLVGFGTGDEAGRGAAPSREYCVPLSLVAPLFDVHPLLPNVLCKGLRLELTLENFANAIVLDSGSDADSAGSYRLTEVELHLDSYRLSDGALNMLNNMSAQNGLVLQYKDWEVSQFQKPNAVTNVTYEMRKAVSMATGAMTVVRATANIGNSAADSLASIPIVSTDQFQYRIGSTYLPIQKIKGKTQYYANSVYCKGRLRSHRELGLTGDEYDKVGHACVDISRYWLENSGVALNNSTSLTWNADIAATQSNIDMFLCHNRVITIFLENIVKSN